MLCQRQPGSGCCVPSKKVIWLFMCAQELFQWACFAQLGVLFSGVDAVGKVLFGLLDSIVHSVERLCEGELCCLGHRRKVGALCLLYKIYYGVDYSMNEYLNNFQSLLLFYSLLGFMVLWQLWSIQVSLFLVQCANLTAQINTTRLCSPGNRW